MYLYAHRHTHIKGRRRNPRTYLESPAKFWFPPLALLLVELCLSFPLVAQEREPEANSALSRGHLTGIPMASMVTSFILDHPNNQTVLQFFRHYEIKNTAVSSCSFCSVLYRSLAGLVVDFPPLQ